MSIGLGLASPLTHRRICFNSSLLVCIARTSASSTWYSIIVVVMGIVVLAIIIISNVWFACIVLKNIRAVYSHVDKSKGEQSK